MTKTNAVLLAFLAFFGSTSALAEKLGRSEGDDGTSSLAINQNHDARQVLDAVPMESVMERFQILDLDGRTVSYVAFTDTDVGGLVFVDKKMLGTVSKHDAKAFYSCRGYTTATQRHWAEKAPEWIAALLSATTPAATVTLNFSGKSSSLSIMEVANNQLLAGLSIFDLSSNPVSMLKKLNAANKNMRVRDKYEKALQSLTLIVPGATEGQLAETLKPEDIYFGDSGLVMSYPRFAYEYFVSAGSVKIAQQPSFHRIARANPALFYVANAKWEQCTPKDWKNAVPEAKHVVETKPAVEAQEQ